MAFGQRKSDRVHFQHDHSVNLMAVDGTWRRGCVLKDISATGARLEVEGSTEVLKAREILHGAVVNRACVSSVRVALGEWLSGRRRDSLSLQNGNQSRERGFSQRHEVDLQAARSVS